MKHKLTLSALLAFTLLLAACAPKAATEEPAMEATADPYAAATATSGDAMSSAASVHMEILRDGLTPELLVQTDIPGGFAETPLHCSVAGCDWPERFRMVIPADWRSGSISFA